MSKKKSKAVVLDSAPPYGVGGSGDARARMRHQSLMQDYVELQQEVNGLRGSLEAAKQRKLILAAEVRFLRRRHKQLIETKNVNTTHEHLVHPPIPLKQTKKAKEQLLHGKEASRNGFPPVREPKPKKRQFTGKQVFSENASPMSAQARKKTIYYEKEAIGNSLVNHKGGIYNIINEALAPKAAQVFNKDQKERMFGANDTSLRNSICTFDLNQDSRPGGEEASLPRAPIFDLNQVSTGEEDFEAMKFEEARKALTRGINDEPQNDLKLSICRNAGEGSSRVGKRKISWQDPVALRV